MNRNDTTKPAAHRHGDLHDALIKAGIDILEEDGLAALTLRKAAARAGVSHAAPAHHFGNKHGLFSAIAAHGYRRFTEVMVEERHRCGSAPRDQLVGICRGYLRFSVEHTALFKLIFSLEHEQEADANLQAAAGEAFGVLEDVCSLFEESAAGPGINELTVWSVVHGYASLSLHKQGQRPEGGPVEIDLLIPNLVPKKN